MTEYKIERWDGIMYGNNLRPMAMIYIKADIFFMEFLKENNNKIGVIINGNNIYNNHKNIPINGFVNKPLPHFFNKTNEMCITLTNCEFKGYPELYEGGENGKCFIVGLKGNTKYNDILHEKEKTPIPKLLKKKKQLLEKYKFKYPPSIGTGSSALFKNEKPSCFSFLNKINNIGFSLLFILSIICIYCLLQCIFV